jgi:hypothetical protein
MSATETAVRPLSEWRADATLAYVLDDGERTFELVFTRDGRAILDGKELGVVGHVRVAEQRAGWAAARAGHV